MFFCFVWVFVLFSLGVCIVLLGFWCCFVVVFVLFCLGFGVVLFVCLCCCVCVFFRVITLPIKIWFCFQALLSLVFSIILCSGTFRSDGRNRALVKKQCTVIWLRLVPQCRTTTAAATTTTGKYGDANAYWQRCCRYLFLTS